MNVNVFWVTAKIDSVVWQFDDEAQPPTAKKNKQKKTPKIESLYLVLTSLQFGVLN